MRCLLCLATLLVFAHLGSSQVILSEIMFNPQGNERYDEFVELYNCSDTESFDLQGWLLSDGSKFNLLLPYDADAILSPQQFALILVPNYFEHSRSYDSEIPDSTLILTIGNAQFGAYGLKNSEGERVSIYRPDSALVDAHTYSPDNKDGYSEEKIELIPENHDKLWGNCVKLNGTPGYRNSLTPLPFDVALVEFTVQPPTPSTRDSLIFHYTVKNAGTQAIDHFTLQLYKCVDSAQQLFYGKSISNRLLPKDSCRFTAAFEPWPKGAYDIMALLNHEHDTKALNDSLRFSFSVQATYPPQSIVINEIMYDTDEKDEEWIEIYNQSDSTIHLHGWSIADKRKTVVLDSAILLAPGDFCLLANDTIPNVPPQVHVLRAKLPELNNGGDILVLKDVVQSVIDSVGYTPQMGGDRMISVERIRFEDSSTNPDNWASCTDSVGGTPGRQNSVSPTDYDASLGESSLNIHPENPRENDTIELCMTIKNSGRRPVRGCWVNIRYRANEATEWTPLDAVPVASLEARESRDITIDWPQVPAGVLELRAAVDWPKDQRHENDSLLDTVFVGYAPHSLAINEIYYSPAEDLGECIELQNTRNIAVNLNGWNVCDLDTTQLVSITRSNVMLDAGDYCIVGGDSALLALHHSTIFICRSFPSLANQADRIFVYDAVGHRNESVLYDETWGGSKGRSLERIHPHISAAEPTNWTTCVDPEGHSLGKINSVFIESVPQDVALEIRPNPFSPDGDGHDDRTAISYTFPGTTAQVNLKIFDIRGRLVRFLFNNEPSGAQRTVFWDGLNDEGIRCRMGIYIVYLEAFNANHMTLKQKRATVVLAGAL